LTNNDETNCEVDHSFNYKRRTISRHSVSSSTSSQCNISQASSINGYEGGDRDEDEGRNGTIAEEYYEEDEEERDIDPDDPYQINILNEIPHEHLKELYT